MNWTEKEESDAYNEDYHYDQDMEAKHRGYANAKAYEKAHPF
jgi:hypothetical protein